MLGEIRIKNYRCFERSTPLVLSIDEGFTAFLGKNNAGKSAILRFIYEYRNLWQLIFDANSTFVDLCCDSGSVGLNGVPDPSTLFNDSNTGDIEIELGVPNLSSKGFRAHITQLKDSNTFRIALHDPNHGLLQFPHRNHPGKPSIEWNTRVLSIGGYPPIDLKPLIRFADVLRSSMYIGPFRNALNVTGDGYLDLNIGSNFVASWAQWKTGENRPQNRLIRTVTSDIARILGFKALDISASQDNRQLHLAIDDKPYKLHEVGSGVTQCIVCLGNAAIRQPSLILIDEPELGLHPSLQLDFLTALGAYARHGVLFSTHSVGLARSAADRIQTVHRSGESSVLKDYEAHPNLVEFLGELGYTNNSDVSSNHVLLVEGAEDVKTYQQFLRKLGKDAKYVLVPLGGGNLVRGDREHELSELTRLTPNLHAIVDSEKPDEKTPLDKDRITFQKTCSGLRIDLHILEKRAIENYFTTRALKAALGERYSELSPYQKLADAPHKWPKKSNWLIAREMTTDEIKNSDLGKFLLALP